MIPILFATIILQLQLINNNFNIFSENDLLIKTQYDILDHSYSNITFHRVLSDSTLKFYTLSDVEKISKPGVNYWLRIRLKNNSGQSCVLAGFKYFDGFVFIPDSDGHYKKIPIIRNSYLWERSFFSNDYVVPLASSNKNQTYYLNIYTNLETGLGCYIASYKYMYNKTVINFVFYSICISIISFVLLFSIVLLIKLRDRLYLFYALYYFH